MTDYWLKDLGNLVKATQKRMEDEFSYEDVCLSDDFKIAVSEWESSCGNSIVYTKAGVVITTAAGQKIYAPNQWFVLATYAVELLKEIMRYREYTEKIIGDSLDSFIDEFPSLGLKDKGDVYKALKADRKKQLENAFTTASVKTLKETCENEGIVQQNTKLLYKFVSDETWWLGGKGIERKNDFYVSPILGVLNLVNASQSYVASITYAYATEQNLSAALPHITADNGNGLCYETSLQNSKPRNRIIFGAPGTGKSYTLNEERVELLGKENETNYERVTFHPSYSYANFVGTYKPVPFKDCANKDSITYEFVPGPFMRVYVEALKNGKTGNPKPFLLIIEEINRAEVAAVFGDVFQLLDRGDNNVSEYPIQPSEDIKKYLADELGGEPDDYSQICIPDNMFIWATMNSADQGVYPVDTAFKRRWDFTYIGIDDNDEKIRGKYVSLAEDKSQKVEWNMLRKAINNFLTKEKINEDKQLGPYFISKNIVTPQSGDEIDHDKFVETFKNKVIMYLFEDAARQKRPRLFSGCSQENPSPRYSDICREFDEKGIKIFDRVIQREAGLETDAAEDDAE